ncbi:MAG: hypothetical protein JWR38_331 [Mucilaginibacter sp.]|nr:hypothetical protein [Mucilaginibacter sp.]
MKRVFQFFKKHPISVIGYILYGWLCFELASLKLQFHERLKHLKPYESSSIIVGGEGIGYGTFFLFIVGGMFLLVIIINAAFRKEEYKFYLWFGLLIIVQTLAVLYM